MLDSFFVDTGVSTKTGQAQFNAQIRDARQRFTATVLVAIF
jgi:hypothetical protein